MRSVTLRFLFLLVFIAGALGAQETVRFRQWMMGLEVGGMEVQTSRDATQEKVFTRQWTHIERKLGPGEPVVVETSQEDSAWRQTNGTMAFAWSVRLGADPLEGTASWSPKTPRKLEVSPRNGAKKTLEVPEDALLWPSDAEETMKAAAAAQRPFHVTTFSFSEMHWDVLTVTPKGPSPLPGFPDAVEFQGSDQSSMTNMSVSLWVSPRHGELKRVGSLGGISVLVQRAELPAPDAPASSTGFFERTLTRLPRHPFLVWLPEVTLAWQGSGAQTLPEDAQQRRVKENVYRVARAAQPSEAERSQPPVHGKPNANDAPFLASTPLVPYQDPIFDGLMARLQAPQAATRWELAQRVTDFVYEWITDKNLSVGFATALEVAKHPKGDCTEHGVLAVALLRKLGVPARGVVGWVGLQNMVGLHFWVEVKLQERWVPVDPTFDQVPASALRLKMGTTDLSDLGSLGWDTASLSFVGGTWAPQGPWVEALKPQGDLIASPDGTVLRLPGARWQLVDKGMLALSEGDAHWTLEACLKPDEETREQAKLLMGSRSRKGWWSARTRSLTMEVLPEHWLQIFECSEAEAFHLLDALEARSL